MGKLFYTHQIICKDVAIPRKEVKQVPAILGSLNLVEFKEVSCCIRDI
jgi:hypothetical protein